MALDAADLRSPAGLLALQSLPRVGPRTALKAAFEATDAGSDPLADPRLTAPLAEATRQVAAHEDAGVAVIGFFDERYPESLREIPDPPAVLFLRGEVELLEADQLIAVIGTREPTDAGRSAAAQLTHEFADAGWGILSGLAKGIDTVAHRSALQAGAPTLAVLGCGLDRVYPAENEALAAQILAAGGALLSEHPFGTEPNPGYLIARDRLQSALAAAVVVAQSGLASGTMHTVRFAASQGTPVFCLEPHSHHAQDEGVRVLLDTPADRLWQKLPAWKDARSLGERLGHQPLAKPLAAGGVSRELDVLETLIAARVALSETIGRERVAPDDARASVFATD